MDKVLVKFPLTIKAKMTDKLKAKMLDELEKGMQQAELEISQINIEENKAIQQESANGQEPAQETMAMIHQHFGVERQKRQEYVAKAQARHDELEKLGPGAEIVQGTTERFVELKDEVLCKGHIFDASLLLHHLEPDVAGLHFFQVLHLGFTDHLTEE